VSIIRLLHPVVMLLFLVFVGTGFAHEPDDESDRWTQIFLQAAKSYELTGEQGAPMKLLAKPLLNWSNPERNTGAGAVFLWTHDGQPAAVMCVYPSAETTLDHEFQSLSETTLQASLNERAVWKPAEPGIEYKLLSEVRPPGKVRPLRLTQMRALARTFSARIVKPDEAPKPLRLLPTPIYRYPDSETERKLVDGAIFAFVQGTDPEVLLMIETVRDEQGTLQWRYATARMSMVPLEASHNDQVVWKRNWSYNFGAPQESYYTIRDIPFRKPESSE
jgi:hypothetical protein